MRKDPDPPEGVDHRHLHLEGRKEQRRFPNSSTFFKISAWAFWGGSFFWVGDGRPENMGQQKNNSFV